MHALGVRVAETHVDVVGVKELVLVKVTVGEGLKDGLLLGDTEPEILGEMDGE